MQVRGAAPPVHTMESLSAERQEMAHMLMAATGIEDAEWAREFLQDSGWQLEPAVNQYMLLTEDCWGAGGGVPLLGGLNICTLQSELPD